MHITLLDEMIYAIGGATVGLIVTFALMMAAALVVHLSEGASASKKLLKRSKKR